LWRLVVPKKTNVSDEHIASIFKVRKYAKQVSSRSRRQAGLFFYPEGGGDMLLRDFGLLKYF
jgi:hypothetical protein